MAKATDTPLPTRDALFNSKDTIKHQILTLFAAALTLGLHAEPVSTVEALTAAVDQAKRGAVIELAAGIFRLTQPLDLKGEVTLRGAGVGKTIVTNAESWSANPATLPEPQTNHKEFDRTGDLISPTRTLEARARQWPVSECHRGPRLTRPLGAT